MIGTFRQVIASEGAGALATGYILHWSSIVEPSC